MGREFLCDETEVASEEGGKRRSCGRNREKKKTGGERGQNSIRKIDFHPESGTTNFTFQPRQKRPAAPGGQS